MATDSVKWSSMSRNGLLQFRSHDKRQDAATSAAKERVDVLKPSVAILETCVALCNFSRDNKRPHSCRKLWPSAFMSPESL